MSIFDALIYNRTQADRDALDALLRKAKEGTLDEAERAEFALGQHRGAYNHTDLNRVTTAQEALWAVLDGYGYAMPDYAPIEVAEGRRYWLFSDTPTPAQLEQYRVNVAALRAALPVYDSTPKVPGDMVDLTLQEANAIEKILVDVDELLQKLAAAWFKSGELQSGEV